MLAKDRFYFIGIEHSLTQRDDWNSTSLPKLWLYNAHYFDDLCAESASDRLDWHRALIERWIAENPPCAGNGWEPYPTSLRIVNWAKWILHGQVPTESMRQSLAVQSRMLVKRLEIHLLGNHLWANAKALIFAGAVFDGPEANTWRNKGLAIVRRELREQILCDGGHFERSPMYHAIILEDVLDLIQLAAIFPSVFAVEDVQALKSVALQMLRWVRVMTHPDGGIAFFNDAAFDIAPDAAALSTYASTIGVLADIEPLRELELLPESGYARLKAGEAVVIVDIGIIGPDYLPGHAHADTLSFELSINGERILVNGGTSTYDVGATRSLQRGTSMHNTVEVDGADSSEVWSSFRVARRARPIDIASGSDSGVVWLKAAHDGYLRLPGRVTHHRHWVLSPGKLLVADSLSGQFKRAKAHFRFAPACKPLSEEPETGVATAASTKLHWRCSGAESVSVEPGTWHPRFGRTEDCKVLIASTYGNALSTEFRWD